MDINDLLRLREKKNADVQAIVGRDSVTVEELDKVDEILAARDQLDRQIEAMRKTMGVANTNPPIDTDLTPEMRANQGRPFATFGEQLTAVATAEGRNGQVDRRLYAVKAQTGLNEGVPADGGYLVQTDFADPILKRAYEVGTLARRVRRIPISANANGLVINAIDEDSRATGSRWGGVRGYWLAEGGTKTPSRPKFRQIELKLKKLIGLCYATDELLQDSTALEGVINEAFPEEFAWLIDEAIFAGTGAGQPLGILNSNALVTVAPEAAQPGQTVLAMNIVKMRARLWSRSRPSSIWVNNQDTEPQLHTLSLPVGVAGVPVYMPANGLSGTPYDSLYGRPVIPIEHCPTLGAAGDIAVIDPREYLMIDKGGVKQATSIHVAFLTDETAFRFTYRCDGQPLWNRPLTPAKGANALSPFVVLAARP